MCVGAMWVGFGLAFLSMAAEHEVGWSSAWSSVPESFVRSFWLETKPKYSHCLFSKTSGKIYRQLRLFR